MDHVGLDHQILIDELGRVGVVGVNAAHLGGCQNHGVRTFRLKKVSHSSLVRQVQLRMGACQRFNTLRLKTTKDRAANHSPVSRDIDFHPSVLLRDRQVQPVVLQQPMALGGLQIFGHHFPAHFLGADLRLPS